MMIQQQSADNKKPTLNLIIERAPHSSFYIVVFSQHSQYMYYTYVASTILGLKKGRRKNSTKRQQLLLRRFKFLS